MEEVILDLPLEQIVPHPDNRKTGGFDEAKLAQLAESIKSVGVQQPILVRQVNSHFELIAGERRWRAAKIAGLAEIPSIVRTLDDLAVLLKIRTIENLQREDVHPLDEADGYAELMEKGGMDVESLAKEVGKSISYIYQRLKLRELGKEARKAFTSGKLTPGHAVLIARLEPKYQQQVLTEAKRYRDVSVRALEEIIQREIFCDLNRAPFKKDDADLLPTAGPCTSCPKRTGAQKGFADDCKKDSCMDPSCYNAKLDALVARNRKGADGKPRLCVATSYPGYKEKWAEGVLDPGHWNECKKGSPGAQEVLIVYGSDRGRVTYGKKSERSEHYYTPSAQEKARAEKEKKARAVKSAYRKNLWDAVIASLMKKLSTAADIPEGLLRLAVSAVWTRLWDDKKTLMAKVEGWEAPPRKQGEYGHPWEKLGSQKIAGMKRPELALMLLKVALIEDRDIAQFQYQDEKGPWRLEAAAKELRIDSKAIQLQIAEKAAPAAKPVKKQEKKAAGKKPRRKQARRVPRVVVVKARPKGKS